MANAFQADVAAGDMTRLADIADNLAYRLPGCDDLTLRKTIQEVYREFCRDTKCLQFMHRVEIGSGEDTFGVSPLLPNAIVGEIREVVLGRMKLRRDLDYFVIEGQYPTVRLDARFAAQTASAGTRAHISVLAVEYPKMGSEETTAGFMDAHGDAIASGVMARLCSMQNRPWSDMQTAASELVRYQDAKSELRMRRETMPGGRCIDTSEIL